MRACVFAANLHRGLAGEIEVGISIYTAVHLVFVARGASVGTRDASLTHRARL